ncbi:MAG: hypothetical protein K2L14_01530 [Duncaniella sp.]|nr:hypothetical protein [Duncaniella sp.]
MLRKFIFLISVVTSILLVGCSKDDGSIPDYTDEFPEASDGGISDPKLNSGIYLGIYAFNDDLYRRPIKELNKESVQGFNSFVDNLTMENGTILYYSVDQALKALQTTPLPPDVTTVALVTFTDGLDQGSMMKNDKYTDDENYLYALKYKIENDKVLGNNITAYCIGLKGTDVKDDAKFKYNLTNLASESKNAIEVASMAEVNAKFKEIAEQLSSTTTVQTVNIKIPGVANGTRIRITFDNPKLASYSSKYIEGIFNLKDKSLEDVEYYGMTSSSGSTVKGTVDGIFVNFVFKGIKNEDGFEIKSANTQEWLYIYSNATWQINSEFDNTENSEIKNEKSSVAIIMVLDCSSSLGSQFKTAQTNAKNFINVLYKEVSDNEESGSGTDPNPDNGNLINGHEYVDLGLPSGLKWATCNVGASSPSEYGDYFAWGETTTKTQYTTSNSVTYNKGFGEISGNAQYDAARANWGSTWRMPAKLEMQELIEKCTWTLTTKSGITGYLVTGPNGNQIFLPHAGRKNGTTLEYAGSQGLYWSSTPDSDTRYSNFLVFTTFSVKTDWGSRYFGRSVRPVSE